MTTTSCMYPVAPGLSSMVHSSKDMYFVQCVEPDLYNNGDIHARQDGWLQRGTPRLRESWEDEATGGMHKRSIAGGGSGGD